MTSEKTLNQQARDFMEFPPKIHNGKTTSKNRDNFGRLEQSRQEVQPGHSCY